MVHATVCFSPVPAGNRLDKKKVEVADKTQGRVYHTGGMGSLEKAGEERARGDPTMTPAQATTHDLVTNNLWKIGGPGRLVVLSPTKVDRCLRVESAARGTNNVAANLGNQAFFFCA
ncbi:unnamed protein product [Scytosiphon promiscuus]